ncbi:GAF and ANTAR domain-containing protein [Kineococcus sp. NBC_00420]|uniref:GAF and ANTAR domain-containing protein n=1 Tax=Kineococcus sp. NBC_00420 TaxID=2903564 RepID=UPI002E205FAF
MSGPVTNDPSPHEQRLAEVFVELADTLIHDVDVADFLQSLTEHCVELLPANAAGLMLADEHGRLHLAAATSSTTRDLGLFELAQEQGPCVDAFTTEQPLLNVAIASTNAATRWPAFTTAAAQAGVTSTSALPMRLHGQVVGALNLLSNRHDPLSATSLALGQALADVATIALLNEGSLREKTPLSKQLHSALQSRVVIEQAKGVLAARAGISVEDAFVWLRRHARSHGMALTQVAAGVVAGELRLDLDHTLEPPAPEPQTPGHQAPRHQAPSATSGAGTGSSLSSDAGAAESDPLASTSETVLAPLDLEILRMIAAGDAGAAVAHRLAIPITEVTLRMMLIRAQLGVTSTAGAVQVARRDGII